MADIQRTMQIDTSLALTDVIIECNLEMGSGGRLPIYDGTYDVTPRKVEQVLPTRNTSVLDNITVREITYTEVSNPYGMTVAIGQE